MTTLHLPDPVARRLQALAKRRGLDPAELVGRMLDDAADDRSAHDRLQTYCGIGTSGRTDTSANVDRYLAEDGYGQ